MAVVSAIVAAIPVSLLSGSPVAAVPAAALTPHVAADDAGLSDAQWAPDEADARAIAAQFGHPVAVDADASPTQLVSAMPDGTMQLEVDAVPQRVKQGSAWVGIDTTLGVDAAGWFAPKASAAPVEFSVGGTDVIEKVQTVSGAWVTETWPYGDLPSPVVEGSSVTYPGVLPGVDLRLTAAPGGVSEVLIVADAAAAANPQLASLRLGVPDATVSVNALAQATAVKADGSSVAAAPPTWWDSSDASSGPGGPGGDAPPRPLGDSTSGSDVTLSIGDALAGAAPVFPVFIDPEWTPSGSPYWFTDAAYPNQSYLNGNYADGIQSVGVSNQYRSDAFWQFSLSSVVHKHILSAVMNTTQVWAASCSLTAIDVHAYGPKAAGFTWNQEQSWSGQWGGILQSRNDNFGCPGVGAHSVGWSVTSAVAAKAAAGASYVQFALTYHDGSSNNSRRHFSQGASLTISYNTPPATPTSLQVAAPWRGCGTAKDPAYLNNDAQAFTLQAYAADADGGNINASFDIVDASQAGSSNPAVLFRQNTGDHATGTVSETFAMGTLTDGKAYAWRVLVGDRIDVSPYSGWCYLTVDDTPPPLPAVTTTETAPVVGQALTVNVTDDPSEHVWAYAYWWTVGDEPGPIPVTMNMSSPWNVALPATGGVRWVVPSGDQNGTTVTVAPIDTVSTLWVAAYDKAGNVSVDAAGDRTAGSLTIPAADGSIAAASPDPGVDYAAGGHGWVTDDLAVGVTSIDDTNDASGATNPLLNANGMTVPSSTAVVGDAPFGGTSLSFPGTQTTATHSERQAIDMTKSFTVSAWLKPAASMPSTGSFTAVSQAGTVNSGFFLKISAQNWQFCIKTQTTAQASDCVTGPKIVPGSWAFVTGIWDAANEQIRLIVGSGDASVGSHSKPAGDVSSSGWITLGSSVWRSVFADAWVGQISDPTVFPGVADGVQIQHLHDQLLP